MSDNLRSSVPTLAYGGLLEAAPDAIVVIDDAGTIVLVNAQTETVFGYHREELLGQPIEVLIPEHLVVAHRKHRAEFAEEPRVRVMGSEMELRGRRRDGSEFPVEVSLSPMMTDEGLLVSASVRDTTAKRREDRLFRGLLEAAPDGMVIVDEEGRIVLVNAQTERLFGYDRTELVGESIEVLVPDESRGVGEALRTEPSGKAGFGPLGVGRELSGRRRDGSEFPVEISLAPLETESGRMVSAAIRDISERREIQRATDRAKDEFIATVSHELRTPLTSIIGYVELLEDLEALSPQARRFLAVVSRSAERERRLVDDLLTLVQIGESGLAIEPVEVDLESIVREAVEVVRPQAEEAGHELTIETPGTAVWVPGDKNRLGQVVDNLLSNAIKFTPSGGRVRVLLRKAGRVARVDVVDNGWGIGEESPEQLFERLYRGEAAVEGQVPGAGLGLPIARAIVEAHGGSVGVAEHRGAGCTFRVELPLGEEEEVRTGARRSGPGRAAPHSRPARRRSRDPRPAPGPAA